MMHNHLGDVKTTNAGFAGAQVPFAISLVAQRACFSAQTIVKQPGARKRFTARYLVHSQRPRCSVTAKLARLRAEVEQCDDGPMQSGSIRKPLRARAAPDW